MYDGKNYQWRVAQRPDGNVVRDDFLYIAEACPDGIDVYFDNVGGETLPACLDNLRMRS